MQLPENHETYVRIIKQRCEDLIDGQIWNGIHLQRLDGWLSNFETPVEKYFSARLLDLLIYRSDSQTQALIMQSFTKILPEASRVLHLGNVDWIDLLSQRKDPGVRLVPVIKSDDRPTKSGLLVLRLIKRHLHLNESWMIWPWQIEKSISKGIKTFIFIDDFLGTGLQFDKFFKPMITSKHEKVNFIYIPLVGFERGIEKIQNKGNISFLKPAELLNDQHCLFSEKSTLLHDQHNGCKDLTVFYVNFLIKKGLDRLGRKAFGYAKLGMAFSFEHATPNATLPIFWINHTGFKSLFDR